MWKSPVKNKHSECLDTLRGRPTEEGSFNSQKLSRSALISTRLKKIHTPQHSRPIWLKNDLFREKKFIVPFSSCAISWRYCFSLSRLKRCKSSVLAATSASNICAFCACSDVVSFKKYLTTGRLAVRKQELFNPPFQYFTLCWVWRRSSWRLSSFAWLLILWSSSFICIFSRTHSCSRRVNELLLWLSLRRLNKYSYSNSLIQDYMLEIHLKC